MLTPPWPFLCCSVASICIFIALRLYYMRQNVIKRRNLRAAHRVANGQDALAEGEDNDTEEVVNEHRNAFNDLTDRQNGAFDRTRSPFRRSFRTKRLTSLISLCGRTDELMYSF